MDQGPKKYIQIFERLSDNKIIQQNIPGGSAFGLILADMYMVTLKTYLQLTSI